VRPDSLPAPDWHQLSELIAARTGLHFPVERRPDLRRALTEVAPEFGFDNGDACAEWLLSKPISGDALRKLASHLTIGETYFFRERPSFNAIATHVLPTLIHRKRGTDRRLRLWSAACSSGEEAYSLAILIQQVLPDWRDWNISILATDINPRFLRKAETGIYGEWSFRESAPDFRAQYFTPAGDRQYRVRADVRELVKFAELNLAQDGFPSIATDTNAMDLILCRNLLIYFTPAHTRRLIASLRQSLTDDGWLVVSPSECSQAMFRDFEPVNFPGSILYRKRKATAEPAPKVPDTELSAYAPRSSPRPLRQLEVATMLAPVAPPPAMPAAPLDRSPPELNGARKLYSQGSYLEAATLLRSALDETGEHSEDARMLGLLVRALANQGVLDEALAASHRWIAADKVDAAAHYLNAMVLQELGDRAGSRAALQRAVYLLPEFTLAHFALGNLARAAARHEEAQRHFANAAHLLRGQPAEDLVPESEGLTVGRLREIIGALSAGGSDA
jgi:chemotaxis protein methyltransferase CheR